MAFLFVRFSVFGAGFFFSNFFFKFVSHFSKFFQMVFRIFAIFQVVLCFFFCEFFFVKAFFFFANVFFCNVFFFAVGFCVLLPGVFFFAFFFCAGPLLFFLQGVCVSSCF